jgi:autophagy-related protein 5
MNMNLITGLHYCRCLEYKIDHGGRVISAMQKRDHNQLWQGLQNDKFDQFWAVNRRLMEVPASSTSFADGGSNTELSQVSSCFKHIPIRLYEGEKSMIQKLIQPTVNAMHDKTSQKDISLEVTSESKVTHATSSLEDDSQSQDKQPNVIALKRLATLRDLLEEILPDRFSNEVNVVTQGIKPDLETPLQWMSEHLSYPDNFLHIVVK